ncbi:MAG: efflux RND transporter periplasmic adaptor subunit [Gammaproteobacteria bacterium]|nr:efflux RND transporter periplasmic adaptor subunit [Gammaproteobacteria bacterium]
MHKCLILIAAALWLTACGEPPAPPAETVRLVKVIEVTAQARVSALALAGEVRARYESPLAFRVGGKVVERNVNLGDSVKTGQVLARIEATDYELAARAAAAAVAAARADLTLAEAELTRYRSLVDKGYVSATALDQKRTAADAARARLKAAEAEHSEAGRQVEYATLKADADGAITALDVNVGQVVGAGQSVLRIARDGNREIEVHVPEASLSQVRSARAFNVTLNAQAGQAIPDRAIKGMLREVSAAADPLTRTYAARIALDDPEAVLQLGMSATVSDVQDGAPVLRLPLSAVVSRNGKPQVWKLDAADSTVHAVDVRTGELDGDGILIEAGIAPGDVVVSAGANLLREGQTVRTLR